MTGSSRPDIEAIGGPSVFTPASGTKGILQLLNVNAGVRSSYVVLDLQLGRRWITSRLYVFCALFEGLPGVRHVVFVETASDTRRRFIGVAGPTSVRVHLGNRDPRLVKRLRHGVRVGI